MLFINRVTIRNQNHRRILIKEARQGDADQKTIPVSKVGFLIISSHAFNNPNVNTYQDLKSGSIFFSSVTGFLSKKDEKSHSERSTVDVRFDFT